MQFTIDLRARGIDYPVFRDVYFSERFNRHIMAAVNLVERTQTEHLVSRNGQERMRVHVVPRIALPGMLSRLLDSHPISYDEVTVFDPASRRASLAIETPAGDIIQVTGQAHLLDEPGGMRLRFQGEARVRLPGVGGMIERFLVNEVTTRYALVEQALQRFIDERRHLPPPTQPAQPAQQTQLARPQAGQ